MFAGWIDGNQSTVKRGKRMYRKTLILFVLLFSLTLFAQNGIAAPPQAEKGCQPEGTPKDDEIVIG